MILIMVELEIVFVVFVLIVVFIWFGVEILNFCNGGVVLYFFSFVIRWLRGNVVWFFVLVMFVCDSK